VSRPPAAISVTARNKPAAAIKMSKVIRLIAVLLDGKQ
jgi:hypothetical protein